MRASRAAGLIAGILLCAGCGPVSRLPALDKSVVAAEQRRQQIAEMRAYYAALHRLDTVAYRLRVANRMFCRGREAAQIGLYAATPRSLPHRFRGFASEALEIGWSSPTAISVVDGAPAAVAGIRPHDEIVALDGELIPFKTADDWMAAWLARNGEKPVRVDLRRDGKDMTVTVTPAIGCSIPIRLVVDDASNAYTDDSKIVINSGIVALAKTDAQLAVVVGHEMAHVWFGHRNKRMLNMLAGTAGGAAIDAGFLVGGMATGGAFTREFRRAGLRAYSVAFEREADYAGAYFAARAGYDLAGAEQIWWEIGQHNPATLRFARTHPLAPARFVQMKAVAAEIAEKRRKHLPLLPDVKEMPDAGASE